MSILSRIFGSKGAGATPAQPVEYKNFQIFPEPIKEGNTFRIAARIVGKVDGQEKEHYLIRADTIPSKDEADEASVGKAKQMIDEQGSQIFR